MSKRRHGLTERDKLGQLKGKSKNQNLGDRKIKEMRKSKKEIQISLGGKGIKSVSHIQMQKMN